MKWKDFSIVIVTKNRYSQLLESVISICDNLLKPLTIIIVDGSINVNTTIIRRIMNICRKRGINLQHIKDYSNLAQCRNIGFSNVHTKYFSFIDDDQYTPKKWTSHVKNIFRDNSKIDVLIGPLLSKHLHNYWNIIWLDINRDQLQIEGRVNFTPGANTCFKTEFLQKNNISFNNRFTYAAEDWGISYVLQKKHAYMYQTPRLTVLHDCRVTIGSFFKQWFKYGQGIQEYHTFYFLEKQHRFVSKITSTIRLLTARYPIYPNQKKMRLIPGYILLNISFLLGYIYSLLRQTAKNYMRSIKTK